MRVPSAIYVSLTCGNRTDVNCIYWKCTIWYFDVARETISTTKIAYLLFPNPCVSSCPPSAHLLLSATILCIFQFYTNTIHDVLFCTWFLSLSIIILRLIHVAACINSQSIAFLHRVVSHCMDIPTFTYLFTCWWNFCIVSLLLAAMNKAENHLTDLCKSL